MICSECSKQNKTSKIYLGMSTRTLIWAEPYYDENGKFCMPDDPNTTTTDYRCSNGHKWTETSGR